MERFFIVAALKSEISSNSKGISQCESRVQLVFHSSKLEHATKRGNVITFDCDKFSVDEETSSSNWRDAFNFNDEPPKGVIITINPGYSSGVVLPYVGWNLFWEETLVLIIISTIFNLE